MNLDQDMKAKSCAKGKLDAHLPMAMDATKEHFALRVIFATEILEPELNPAMQLKKSEGTPLLPKNPYQYSTQSAHLKSA